MSVIKESSDELNPAVEVSSTAIPPGKTRRTFGDYVVLAIATVGVGYFPIAPGTLGALVGVGLYLAVWTWVYQILEANAVRGHLNLLYIFTPLMAAMLLLIVIVTIAGTWAATRAEKLMQRKDPSAVV